MVAQSSAEGGEGEPPLAPVNKKSSIPEEDENAMANIDRVCRLVHELKIQGCHSALSFYFTSLWRFGPLNNQ